MAWRCRECNYPHNTTTKPEQCLQCGHDTFKNTHDSEADTDGPPSISAGEIKAQNLKTESTTVSEATAGGDFEEPERWERPQTADEPQTESLRLSASIAGRRIVGWVRTLVRFAGVVLVLVAVYNMFVAPLAGTESIQAIRVIGPVAASQSATGFVYIADVLLIAIGSVLVWFI